MRPAKSALQRGRIIAAFGRRFVVEADSGWAMPCVSRSKKVDFACGDFVLFATLNEEQGVIEQRLPRSTLLYRADFYREKLLAANLTQAIVVIAGRPSPSEALLDRCLTAAVATGIRPLIAANKADLAAETASLMARLTYYADAGYPLLTLSAKAGAGALRPLLSGDTSVLVGQSGMGKSTLINALVPEAQAATGDLSTALDAGRHTTTATRLYHLDVGGTLIDSPGLQEFGLWHLDDAEVAAAMLDFRPYLGQCRFANCRHVQEPGCKLAAAAEAGTIRASRLEFYRRVVAEHDQFKTQNPDWRNKAS